MVGIRKRSVREVHRVFLGDVLSGSRNYEYTRLLHSSSVQRTVVIFDLEAVTPGSDLSFLNSLDI